MASVASLLTSVQFVIFLPISVDLKLNKMHKQIRPIKLNTCLNLEEKKEKVLASATSPSNFQKARARLANYSEVVVLISFVLLFIIFTLTADNFLSLLSITNILTIADRKSVV